MRGKGTLIEVKLLMKVSSAFLASLLADKTTTHTFVPILYPKTQRNQKPEKQKTNLIFLKSKNMSGNK